MTDYSKQISKSLVGRTIKSADVNGNYVQLTFENGDMFEYHASDRGRSLFGIIRANNSKEVAK